VRVGVVVRRLADGLVGAPATGGGGGKGGGGRGPGAAGGAAEEEARLRALMRGWAAHTSAPQVGRALFTPYLGPYLAPIRPYLAPI
jgi:hypothetical protein